MGRSKTHKCDSAGAEVENENISFMTSGDFEPIFEFQFCLLLIRICFG